MFKKSTLLDALRSARTEQDLDRLGFKYNWTIIDWPGRLRKKMWEYIGSDDKVKQDAWGRLGKKYYRKTFRPKDELLCVMSGERLLYPSIRYEEAGNRLKFKGIGIYVKEFNPSDIIDCDTGAKIDSLNFVDEMFGDNKQLRAVTALLQ